VSVAGELRARVERCGLSLLLNPQLL